MLEPINGYSTLQPAPMPVKVSARALSSHGRDMGAMPRSSLRNSTRRMAYRVKMMPRAQRDLAGLYGWIGALSSDAALAWYRGLRDAVRALRVSPHRCPATPEDGGLRHLLYGNKPHIYRVIYRILEQQKQVDVLHIRHGARQEFDTDKLT